jgi:hypothetical protein
MHVVCAGLITGKISRFQSPDNRSRPPSVDGILRLPTVKVIWPHSPKPIRFNSLRGAYASFLHSPGVKPDSGTANAEQESQRGGQMQTKIAFCRFRGIKAGRYVWNCFRCKRWLRNCCELACLAVLATHLLLGPTESESTTLSANAAGTGKQPVKPAVLEACIVPVNPATHSMRALLTRHQVPETNLRELAEAIVNSATKYALDPKLIASITIIESRGNPFAISGKAAVGVMQIHVPTWGPAANREGINLFEIEDNIDFGTRILRDYIRRFGVWEGVKRYNGFVRGNEASEQSADAYVSKVQQIYERG